MAPFLILTSQGIINAQFKKVSKQHPERPLFVR